MIISKLEECRKNKERINVSIDGEFAFACYKEVAVERGVAVGKEFSQTDIEKIKYADGEMYAIKTAMSYVAARQRTKKDIERKLKDRDIAAEHIEKAVSMLEEYGYVCDEEYAEVYARELAERYPRRMVRQKLMQKGIESSLAEQAVKNINDMPLLARLYERYEERYADEEQPKRGQKIVRALMQKGFSYGDIQSVMENGYYEE